MSDQTPSLNNVARVDGSNVFGTPGGSGTLTSINGDGTPAQLLLAGTGITIVDGGGGAHTISLSGATGIASINADTTAAQVLSAGFGIGVVDGGGGAHTISVIPPVIGQTDDPGTVIPDHVFTAICSNVLAAPSPQNLIMLIGQVTFPGTVQTGSFALQIFDVTAGAVLAEASASLASNGTTNETLQVVHIGVFANPTTVELRVFYTNSGGAGATLIGGGATRMIRKQVL